MNMRKSYLKYCNFYSNPSHKEEKNATCFFFSYILTIIIIILRFKLYINIYIYIYINLVYLIEFIIKIYKTNKKKM